jgi:hypothetical protein
MRKDLTLCLDSFSGVEKTCFCIENTSKTFHPCPMGKFKLQNVPFHFIFCPEGKNITFVTTYLSATGVCNFREPTHLSASGVCKFREPTQLSALGVYKFCEPTYISASVVCKFSEPTYISASVVCKFCEPTHLSATAKSFKRYKYIDRTLPYWNKPYY